MLIGDVDYPLAEAICTFLLIVSLIVVTLLFRSGEGNYSIKYKLMDQNQFFLDNQYALYAVEYLYKAFFILPFVLLIAIAIMQAVSDPKNLAPILTNGLIIILMLYPIKTEFYYMKLTAVWALAFGSQMSTLFIYLREDEAIYYILSVIFYSGNILFFFVSMLAIEGVYWQISEATLNNPQEIKEVNEEWSQGPDRIPQIFNGGLYGFFCRGSSDSRTSYKFYLIFYVISLCFLGLYAFLVYLYTGSYLGIVGLVSNIIYDIFIKIFARLTAQGRSLTTIYVVLVAGRLLSFVFGSNLWVLGYCILYFGVATFIGWIIINKHLPLQQVPQAQPTQSKTENLLKTPEFVIFILTLEIIVMIVSQVYGVRSIATVEYNGITIPIWQWGILAILAAWVLFLYMVSVRIFKRHKYHIHASTEYYLGFQQLTEEHLYILAAYVLIIVLGLYSHLYLRDTVILLGCIFVPLLYLCGESMGQSWCVNDYQILADTDDYNKQMSKKGEIERKRAATINKNDKLQSRKKEIMLNKFSEDSAFKTSIKRISKLTFSDNANEEEVEDRSSHMLSFNFKGLYSHDRQSAESGHSNKMLRNWRTDEQISSPCQIWDNLTPTDKKIILLSVCTIVLLISYCLTCSLWAGSKFAISFTVCVFCYASLLPFYRCYQRKADVQVGELIVSACGLCLGIIYWSVFNSELVGSLAYSFIYIVVVGFLLFQSFAGSLTLTIKIVLTVMLLLQNIFILITLGIQKPGDSYIGVWVYGLIVFVAVVLMAPAYYQLVHDYIPLPTIIVSSLLIDCTVIGLTIGGYVTNILSSFALFTIVMGMIFAAFLLSSMGVAFGIYNDSSITVVYSSYGMPHYKFDSAEQRLKSNMTYVVLFSFSSISLVIYAGVVSIFFSEKFWGICALSLMQLSSIFVEIMLSLESYYFIGSMRHILTNDLIIESLRKLKNEYMLDETEGEDSPFYLQKLEEAKKEAEESSTAENWKKVVTYHNLYVKNVKEETKFLFFWLALIKFHLTVKSRQEMLDCLAELKQIEQELLDSGIFLESLNENMGCSEKYKKVMTEIQGLKPLDHIIYEEILAEHRTEKEHQKKEMKDISEREEEINVNKQESLFKAMDKMEEPGQEISRFNQLIKDLGKRNLFADEEFPANEKSLGALQSLVASWRRPSLGEVLAKDGMSAGDVKQGNIGDCYLISTFGVLGELNIKRALGISETGINRWTNAKGAYMVRFFKFSKEVFITIDDQLPVNEEEEWVFAKSEDPNEFWPCILEKAYAKLYAGYHNIVEGKVHRVLAEFTGGFPFEIKVDEYKSNPNGLWTRITSGMKNGYLMGAGSPSHPNGDTAFSKRGIVQGHAYALLDAREVDNYRLVKLKNPHGSAGREWIGDFADRSDLMTKRMLEILQHEISEDGLFWMTVQDFIYEFKSLYICAVFDDEAKWKKIRPVNGQWTDQNSMGLPNSPNCQFNPQYGIKVNKKSTIFISLTQESKSALKGKNFIYMRVQKNNGKRMKQEDISSENLLGKPQRPIDSVTVSSEISLQAPNYPYTFTLLVCTGELGNTGKFTLEFYCDDKQFEVTEDSAFDRAGKS